MRTRKLGWTDVELTTIGLGTWAMGGGGWQFGWGPQDDDDSIKAIQHALDIGVNWIDTAAVYGLGHSEEVIGQAVKGMKERPFIATKCGRTWDENRNIFDCLKKDSVRRECEDSLRRLQVETIDLYQIHWPMPDEEFEEGWSTMADLVKEGKIRYVGVSNFDVNQLERIQPVQAVASLQPPYSMFRRDIEKEILDFCSSNEIGAIVYSPMQKGLLTGKITPERMGDLPSDDHRLRDPLFQEPALSANLKRVERLRPIAERNERSLAQLAIAWTLRRPEVTAAIVGTRSRSQIEETAVAGEWRLSTEDATAIDSVFG